jgi:hypothetical protein
MNVRHFLAALLFAALPAAAAVSADQTTTVIEFYNQSLDHYFMTADTAEAADLDNGVHPGWKRTGLTFLALKPGASVAGSTPIGRFYGSPDAGLDSHFYTASAQETAAVQDKFAGIWLLESPEVFRAMPVDPNTGKCPSDFEPIYRLYNKRSDVNHRYTDDLTVFQSMVAKGYVAEGNGNPNLPVIFCMPSKDNSVAPAGTPSCTLSATSTAPLLGTFITITATCTNAPTQYGWTNCPSALNTCTIASATAGTTTYSVVGTNATGAGNTAKVDINWGATSGPVPMCTLSASNTSPQTGTNVTLTANCSQSPTQYAWMTCNYLIQTACNFIATCSSTSSTCTTTQSASGLAHYAVAGTNTAGQGPRAGIDIDWSGNGTGGGGGGGGNTAPVCTVNPSNSSPIVGTTIQLFASCTGSPTSYAWTNCTSTTSTCSVSSANAGNVSYSVVGSNSIGNGAPASTTVSWQRPAPPTCTASASNPNPMVGANVTLTASCSGSPTSYVWTGCAGSTSSCVTTASSAGAQQYSVSGVNASGTGSAANVTVNWQPQPTAPPSCTVSSSDSAPFTGQSITLTASCNNSPTSYKWTNCSSTTSTCSTTSGTAGTQTYSVSGTNGVGTGTAASVNVNWQQSTAPPDLCGQYRSVRRLSQGWGNSTPIVPSNFGANEILVVAVNVPSVSGSNANFGATVSEYQSAPSSREITLSRSACDFRPVDRSGQNGPISLQFGNTASAYGSATMPSGTWYFNVRSANRDGSGSCATSVCNIIVGFHF